MNDTIGQAVTRARARADVPYAVEEVRPHRAAAGRHLDGYFPGTAVRTYRGLKVRDLRATHLAYPRTTVLVDGRPVSGYPRTTSTPAGVDEHAGMILVLTRDEMPLAGACVYNVAGNRYPSVAATWVSKRGRQNRPAVRAFFASIGLNAWDRAHRMLGDTDCWSIADGHHNSADHFRIDTSKES